MEFLDLVYFPVIMMTWNVSKIETNEAYLDLHTLNDDYVLYLKCF